MSSTDLPEVQALLQLTLTKVPLHVLRSPSVGLSWLADRIEKANQAIKAAEEKK